MAQYGESFTIGNFAFEDELTLKVKIVVKHYDSGYEPYPTSNHDDPRYSDPGESSEADYRVYLERIDNDEVYELLDITNFLTKEDFEYIDEQIDEYAQEVANDAYQSAQEDRYEEDQNRI